MFFSILGIFTVLYLLWPSLVIPENWKCLNDIMVKTSEDNIYLKAALKIFAKA